MADRVRITELIGAGHETTDPEVIVVFDEEPTIPLGEYTFELRVMDNAEQLSEPAEMTIVFVDPPPHAVPTGPESVNYGEEFPISGARSTDTHPGHIVQYIWKVRPPEG